MFWPFSGSGGPPSTPRGPQRFLIDDLVHHDNLRGNMLQQDDFTMGRISVTQLKGGPTKYMINLGMFWASSGLRCPLKDPPGSPMVPNRHFSVPLDF